METISELSIGDWKDLTNIIFFVSATIVAWLSYIAVKNSVLIPMKNEVLKYQLDDIKKVLLAFRCQDPNKGICDDLDLNEISKINTKLLVSHYIDVVFKTAHGHIDNSYVVKNERLKDVDKGNCYIVPGAFPDTMVVENMTSLKDATFWDEKHYVFGVALTKKCETKMEQLEQLASSPLLPEDLIKLIEDYLEKTGICWVSMIKALNECKEKLNFKGEIKLEVTDYEILSMQCHVINSTDVEPIYKKAEEIIKYVRNYLKVNKIMK